MENTDVFTYRYSAEQSKEVARIRSRYLPKEENKLEVLRKLDRRVQTAGTAVSLCLGILGCLLFGIGMCFFLRVFAGGPWLAALFFAVGAAPMLSAYPVYRHVAAKAKERLVPEILRLTEELS